MTDGSEFGTLLMSIGWVGAVVFIVIHTAGVILGLWGWTAATWWIALAFLLLMNAGVHVA